MIQWIKSWRVHYPSHTDCSLPYTNTRSLFSWKWKHILIWESNKCQESCFSLSQCIAWWPHQFREILSQQQQTQRNTQCHWHCEGNTLITITYTLHSVSSPTPLRFSKHASSTNVQCNVGWSFCLSTIKPNVMLVDVDKELLQMWTLHHEGDPVFEDFRRRYILTCHGTKPTCATDN